MSGHGRATGQYTQADFLPENNVVFDLVGRTRSQRLETPGRIRKFTAQIYEQHFKTLHEKVVKREEFA